MIDELLDLSQYIEQYNEYFVEPMRKEAETLNKRKILLEPSESKRLELLERKINFCERFVMSIKTCQELAVVNRLALDDFRAGVKEKSLMGPKGFRKQLLQGQVDWLNEFYGKIKEEEK